jgi:flagellar M-ring protein FliF
MEPLLKALRDVGKRLAAMPAGLRLALGGLAAMGVVVALAATFLGGGGGYQYVFTNLTAEDATEAAAALKSAGIAFRAEANGSALAVPASDVHEARLLLAGAGLPRGGGVGFELFDRGDLGASEFTQRVNLRRATEGELARTIGHLSAVRSARVHLTLPERSLYRDDDRKVAAAVVVNLQPGRTLAERELAGIRHLVSSAVPGMSPEMVSVMDGRGMVLSGDRSDSARLASQQREVESGLEQRIVELLEPAVGAGSVVAKVTAELDTSEVEVTSDTFDPESQTVRSQRKVTEQMRNDSVNSQGTAGAAANAPLDPAAGAGPPRLRAGETQRDDEVKNYEISKRVTRTVTRTPRVTRLSAAVLVDGVAGNPRAEAEVRRLADLAKRVMGFDEQRGDRFEISSAPFSKRDDVGSGAPPFWTRPEYTRLATLAVGALFALGIVVVLLRRSRGGGPEPMQAREAVALLRPGAKVGEAQAALAANGAPAAPALTPVMSAVVDDPVVALQAKARELSKGDPTRAAQLLRSWVSSDTDPREAARG